jgi:DNA end-binding protein Ku
MAKEKRIGVPGRPIWSGSITIGLVNVPVKLHAMIFDKGVSFRFLHKDDGQPLRYEKVCTKDEKVVPWENVARGYEVSKDRFVVVQDEELKAARPESNRMIRLQKFIDYLSIDPIYLDRPYLLTPDKSDDAYSLLLTTLKKMAKAGVGRITIREKEYPVLVHPYKNALVLTTLRYAYEIADPSDLEDLNRIKEPAKEELDLAKKIVGDLSGEFDITEYRDTYQEKVKALIEKKMKGETIVVEQPAKEEAKELMVALQETLRQLKKK